MRRLFVALFAVLAAASAVAGTLTVMVQEAKIRKKPQFYAQAMATARLGDKLEAGSQDSGWYAVSTNGRDGFIHQSAVTAKKVRLSSGDSVGGSGPSAEDVTLAGKGFNEQVEKSYRSKNGSLDFSAVDAMEERSASDAALARFMREGGLLPAEVE